VKKLVLGYVSLKIRWFSAVGVIPAKQHIHLPPNIIFIRHTSGHSQWNSKKCNAVSEIGNHSTAKEHIHIVLLCCSLLLEFQEFSDVAQ
jgi:hypothetical protein